MYRNARAEMIRAGYNLETMAEAMGMAIGTLSQKLNGKYQFTLDEAKLFKRLVKTDLPLEVLFEVVA